jgi:pimeloyl-ACP methyl ester carboxylesterase
MYLLLLPGMDGTGRLFEPLLPFLPPSLVAAVVAYPPDKPYDFAELLPYVAAAIPDGQEYLILGESFSGPLALLLAARQSPGLRGVILCASFTRCPLLSFAQWFRGLIRPWWFRAIPKWLIRSALLGRFSTPRLARLVENAIGGV